MTDIRPEYPIGKTQWAKWGNKARLAYNHCIRVGFTFETAVAEANAVQAKLSADPEAEVVVPAEPEKKQDAEGVTPPAADEVVASPSPTASAPKKPRTPKKKAE